MTMWSNKEKRTNKSRTHTGADTGNQTQEAQKTRKPRASPSLQYDHKDVLANVATLIAELLIALATRINEHVFRLHAALQHHTHAHTNTLTQNSGCVRMQSNSKTAAIPQSC